jgi:hypothetical protein
MQYIGLHARLEEVGRQALDSKDNVALWSLGPGTDQLVRALLAHPRGLPRPEDVAALSVRVQLRLLRDLAARIQAPDTEPVDDAAVALYASLHHALPIALARPDTAANAAGALVARTAAAPQPNESGLRAALDAANRVCGILLGLPEQAAHAWDAALKVSSTAVRPALSLCRVITASRLALAGHGHACLHRHASACGGTLHAPLHGQYVEGGSGRRGRHSLSIIRVG